MSVLSFSDESGEKPTTYDLLFVVAIYSPKNDNKHQMNATIEINTRAVTLL